mgnify:CR=1 FL=1
MEEHLSREEKRRNKKKQRKKALRQELALARLEENQTEGMESSTQDSKTEEGEVDGFSSTTTALSPVKSVCESCNKAKSRFFCRDCNKCFCEQVCVSFLFQCSAMIASIAYCKQITFIILMALTCCLTVNLLTRFTRLTQLTLPKQFHPTNYRPNWVLL